VAPVRIAVVGHVEWVWFAVVSRFPVAGEIIHATESFEEAAAGGGGVAATQLVRMGAEVDFFTALGDDERGHEAERELTQRGVRVHAAWRAPPQRRAFTLLDDQAERTIVVVGERHVPHGDDALPWERLDGADGVYFTGGDAGALAAARRARTLVATTRARGPLAAAGVALDALVLSGTDPGEMYTPGEVVPEPVLVVMTLGARGGRWTAADGRTGEWTAQPLPGPPVDAYGCGDTFAAALTLALGRGDPVARALDFAARAGAKCLTGRGPFGAQLDLA
jgi:ribokinase